MRNLRFGCGVLCLAAMVAGCAADSDRSGPTPIAASAPARYPLERERPGGAAEAVPSEQAPIARPLRDDLPPIVVRGSPAETGTALRPPVKPPTSAVTPTGAVPRLDPTAGQTMPLMNAILAQINGDVITREDIAGPLRPQIEMWRQNLSPDEFAWWCKYYINEDLMKEISRRLVLQEAKATLAEDEKRAIDAQVAAEEKDMVSDAGSKPRLEARLAAEGTTLERENARERERLMVQRLLKQKVPANFQVTHGELLALYEKVKVERFVVPDEAHLLLITLKKSDSADAAAARAKAEAVHDRARRGEDFAKLAAQYSADPKAQTGGDWGMVGRNSLKAEAVTAAVFTLKRGGLAPLVETDDGFYIVRCLERQEGRTKPFAEVQGDLEKELRRQKQAEAVQAYLDVLQSKAYLKIFYENM
jgi:peptidyl-prolyl cis-trans isomerase C